MSVNSATIIGRLGADPEAFSAGCKIRIATDYKGKDGAEQTEWHRITCFGKTAENVMRFLHKGGECYVEGRIQTSTYEKNGEKRYSTEIIANRVVFLGGKSQGRVKAANDNGPVGVEQGGGDQRDIDF